MMAIMDRLLFVLHLLDLPQARARSTQLEGRGGHGTEKSGRKTSRW
jgi:hypothetical protein